MPWDLVKEAVVQLDFHGSTAAQPASVSSCGMAASLHSQGLGHAAVPGTLTLYDLPA